MTTCCYIYPKLGDGHPELGEIPQDEAVPCQEEAEWEIWDSPDPYNCTRACSDHVGWLLNDSPEHRVYPVKSKAP